MKPRDLANLLNRAAAALETPADLSPEDRAALAEDLTVAANDVAMGCRWAFRIYNSKEHLWWSNRAGWVDARGASVFTLEEHRRLNLPVGGHWVRVRPTRRGPAPCEHELVVWLADGYSLRSSSETRAAGEYVRLVDGDGREVCYWHFDEWRDDPELVMGAILCAAAEPAAVAAILRKE